ncbi:MAG: enoyl-CoA hydratase/isomerase family protein, partial [Phenylobacterium sp.]
FDTYNQLESAVRETTARCLVITGSDPAFCSGDDVRAVMGGGEERKKPIIVTPRLTPAADALLHTNVPIVAAVNGAAVGWGMELALFADIRIASDAAKFAELFVKRGLPCDVGGFYRLPAIVGPAKAAELLFTGDVIDAAEALRIGLVSEVVAPADLLPRANALAARIAANPPLAVQSLKAGLALSAYGDPAEIGTRAIAEIFRLMQTHDHREGVASFLEKRPPVFEGR